MNFFNRLIYSLVGIFIWISQGSCTGETSVDCSLVDCAVDQSSVLLEFFSNGESILSNQRYSLDQISVSSAETSTTTMRLFPNATEGLDGILELNDENWSPGIFNYILRLGNDWSVPLEIAFEVSTGVCCGGRLRVAQLRSTNNAVEEKGNGYYRIQLQ